MTLKTEVMMLIIQLCLHRNNIKMYSEQKQKCNRKQFVIMILNCKIV